MAPQKKIRDSVEVLARKENPISGELIRLMLGMGGFEEEFNLFNQQKAIEIAGGIGESALPLVAKAFKTGNRELKIKAVDAAGKIGEPALHLIEQAFKTGEPVLQMAAVHAAETIGEPALHLIEQAFKTGEPVLQMAAVHAAETIGEPALPLLKRILKNKNLHKNVRIRVEKKSDNLNNILNMK